MRRENIDLSETTLIITDFIIDVGKQSRRGMYGIIKSPVKENLAGRGITEDNDVIVLIYI